MKLKAWVGGVAAAALLIGAADADALTLNVKTKAGRSCPISTIAQPTTYGLSIPDCAIPVKQIFAAGYLIREQNPGKGTGGGSGGLPIPSLPSLPPLPDLPDLPGVPSLPVPGLSRVTLPPLPVDPTNPLDLPPIDSPINPTGGLSGSSKLAGASIFPRSSTLPYHVSASTTRQGNAVRIEFTVRLRSKKRNLQRWRTKTGGKACFVTSTRKPADTLQCSTLEGTA